MSRFVAFAAVATLLAACGSKTTDPLSPPLGLETLKLVPSDDPPTADKVELGKALFFDPRLSGSGKTSCSTCHQPDKAWTDGKPFSPKDDGSMNTRNTPTVENVGYYEKLYWDGRAPSLEKNVLAAWTAQTGGKPDEVGKKLGEIAGYRELFQKAYGQAPSADLIVKALASFLRMLRGGNSPFDRWQAGEQDAVTNDVKIGYELFTGKAGCVACHTPPLFTDHMFHNVGIGFEGTEKPDPGAGGEKALNDPAKFGAMKTPCLRDVAKTAPYFHNASRTDLLEAVKFMAGGGHDNPHKDPALLKRDLSETEIKQLVALLQSLTSDVPFTPPALPQ